MPSARTLYASVIKNLTKMIRNPTTLLLILLLPMLEVVVFSIAIGKDPKELPIALVNHELPKMLENCESRDGCDVTHISCQLIKVYIALLS